MESVTEGIGEIQYTVFDNTTPEKRIETAYSGAKLMQSETIDGLVAVGGGSSINIATIMSILHRDYPSIQNAKQSLRQTGTLTVDERPRKRIPRINVPTTFAGAELSSAAGVTVPDGSSRKGILVSADNLIPSAVFYDPELFETTPKPALYNSVMNCMNKGIEGLYSRNANPITEALSFLGLRYFYRGISAIEDEANGSAMEQCVLGDILLNYGGTIKLSSIIHAFGHAIRRHGQISQGVAHAIVTPAVLRFLFERHHAQRNAIADAIAPDRTDGSANAVVETIEDLCRYLSLPSRLRDVGGITRSDIPVVARLVEADTIMLNNGPDGFSLSLEDAITILERAW
jgi:alcohol dehydrogenase class IV